MYLFDLLVQFMRNYVGITIGFMITSTIQTGVTKPMPNNQPRIPLAGPLISSVLKEQSK